LEFLDEPSNDQLKEQGIQIIQDIIKNASKELLSKIAKVFKSEKCVICLEGNVDAIYYQCGHQCCHYKCGSKLKNCPLCRNHITAIINVN